MTGMHWGGDPLPPGLSYADRAAWPIAATLAVRFVPDPVTGEPGGLSVEYHSSIPKVLLVDQLMTVIRDLVTHCDFQDGIRPVDPPGSCDEHDEGGQG